MKRSDPSSSSAPETGSAAPSGAVPLLIVLAAAFTVSQFYRTAPAVIAPELRSGLALTSAQLGLAAGAFFVAFSLMHLPIGVLLDRYGPRRVMSAMLVVSTAGAVAFSQAGGALGLIIAQLLVGAGCSAMFVGGLVVVAQRFPPARFGGLAATLTSISGLGMIASGTPFAALTEGVGWRTAFLIVAGLSLTLAAIIFWVIPRRGEQKAEGEAETFAQSIKGLGRVFRHGPVWGVIALAMVTYPTIITIRGFWGGPYLSDVHGADTIERGNILLIMSLATMTGAALYAILERRTTKRLPFIYLAAGASSLGCWLLALAPVSSIVVAAGIFMLIGLFSFGSVLLLAHARDMFPPELTGRAITSVNFTSFLGAGLMQFIPGIVLGLWPAVNGHPPEEAYRAVFGGIGAMLLLAILIFTIVFRQSVLEGLRRRRKGATSDSR